jgi:uncharacterized protein with HEPN domain
MKDPRVYLAHILERIERIEAFTQDRTVFFDDRMGQDAVLYNLMVIGEATKRIDDTYRTAHPEVPWRSMAATRDVLIHDYPGVSLQQVWQIVEHDLPPLKAAILALLPPLDQLEAELAGDTD